MNTTLKRLTLIGGVLLAGVLLLALTAGITLAQGPGNPPGGFGWGHGPGMGGGWRGPGSGMMGGWQGMGPGMRGGWRYGSGPTTGNSGTLPYGYGPGSCPGMAGGLGYGYAPQGDPITADDALEVVEQYLAAYNDPDLVVAEVMTFSQNFYVQVQEASSGLMAFELLVDPYTGYVHPEPGPNMMWNTKYGHMAGRWGYNAQSAAEMPLNAEQSGEYAQNYLDRVWPGTTADDHVDTFYGYYTLHVLQDGQIVGMLSVNGYTGQVWYHTWHGDFIAMAEGHPE
jgi:hypothetical protein